MQPRHLWIAVVVASCAKSAKEAAPPPGPETGKSETASSGELTGGAAPTSADPTTQPPPPGGQPIGGDGPKKEEAALEQARRQASLGPSVPSSAFDPIGEAGRDSTRKKGKADKTNNGSSTPTTNPVAQESTRGPTRGPTTASASAQVGAVLVDGKPAPAALAQALKVRVSDVQGCYDKAGVAGLRGALRIAFVVMPSGALGSASVESTTLRNIQVESCVIGVIQAIKLAKPLATTETKATVAISFDAK